MNSASKPSTAFATCGPSAPQVQIEDTHHENGADQKNADTHHKGIGIARSSDEAGEVMGVERTQVAHVLLLQYAAPNPRPGSAPCIVAQRWSLASRSLRSAPPARRDLLDRTKRGSVLLKDESRRASIECRGFLMTRRSTFAYQPDWLKLAKRQRVARHDVAPLSLCVVKRSLSFSFGADRLS